MQVRLGKVGHHRDDELPLDRPLRSRMLMMPSIGKDSDPFEGDLVAAAGASIDAAARDGAARAQAQIERAVLALTQIVLIFVEGHNSSAAYRAPGRRRDVGWPRTP